MKDLLLIGLTIVLMSFIFFKYRKKHAHFSVPNMLTSIGILGTFVGVCFGLAFFDVNQIDRSIPDLLSGLKFAFTSSVFGIFFSLVYRTWFPLLKEEREIANASIEDIIREQHKLFELQNEFNTKSFHQFSNIEKALVGDGDSTLLTQIQKLRTTFSDKQEELIKEFREFANNMAKNNMDALTSAIQNLITDFNKKITDEFGENFKQLNFAVEKMVEWQQNYKEQVAAMISQLDQSIKGIEKSEKSLKIIAKHSETITTMSEKLDKNLNILTTELSAFSEMGEKAKNAFPYINEEIKKLTTGLHETVEKVTQENKKMIEFHQESLTSQSNTITKHHTDVIKQIDASINNTNSQMEKLVNENSERVAKQVAELDKSLGEELEKTISTLGSQLHSLSSKFVEDYLPLTTKLKEVVELARKV